VAAAKGGRAEEKALIQAENLDAKAQSRKGRARKLLKLFLFLDFFTPSRLCVQVFDGRKG
jgi:hypothetical protein